MPQPKKGPRLGSGPDHQRSMLSNLAVSLFEHERIKTTEAKAKTLRPFAEKLITKAKKGDLHNRRLVLSVIEDRDAVHKLFAEIAPRFANRNGGYTRILKIGPRAGDGAPMCLIELVGEGSTPDAITVETAEGKKRRLTRRKAQLPQDKPVRSRAAEAAAAGQTTTDPDLMLEDEAADADAPDADAPDASEADAPEAEAPDEQSAQAATDEAEAAGAEAQADGSDVPDTGGEGVKDQK